MNAVTQYFFNVLVAVDQLANTLLAGDPDETVSSRAAKAADNGTKWGCVLCRLLDYVDNGHCRRYIEPQEGQDGVIKD